ncbi:MAG: two-component regulator propeller domain-containing protein [Bacteroidales bacterium]|jgi:signal transduction histidine kinase/ligand-binding sensor domain-containing protein/DNA-binding response OmpR family regulator|nr:two-component regulator propeller domain-containing protein [Bacteroidales bacterium]
MKTRLFFPCVTLLVCILGFEDIACAQAGRFYSSGNELSNSLINQVFQDSTGFVWVATENGLNRIDGHSLRKYHYIPGDSSSLKNNYVHCVYQDSGGTLWVGCLNGLQRYLPYTDSFEEISLNVGDARVFPHIMQILETRNGDLWIATSGQGCFVRPGTSGERTRFYRRLTDSLDSDFLTTLYEDPKGNLWLSMREGSVWRYNSINGVIQKIPFPPGFEKPGEVPAYCTDKQGNVFLGSLSEGLFRYDAVTESLIHIPYYNGIRSLPVKSLLADANNRVLVGTDGKGLKYYDRDLQQVVDYPSYSTLMDLSRTKVHCLMEDRDGNLWMGLFQRGVYVSPSNPSGFTYYGSRSYRYNNIGSACVMSLACDEKDNLWVGTDGDGLYQVDPEGNRLLHLAPSDNPGYPFPATIMSLCRDNGQNLWIGSYINGIGVLNVKTKKFTYRNDLLGYRSEGYNLSVGAIVEGKDKTLWIGTWGNGIYHVDPSSGALLHHYFSSTDGTPVPDEINNNWINTLFTDSFGLMWAGTFKGLTCIDPVSKKAENFLSSVVYTVTEATDGRIWAGTIDGLVRYDKTTREFTSFRTSDGLPSNVICGLQTDFEGNIWMSTHSGIARFIPGQSNFSIFTDSDGIEENEFSRNALAQTSRGCLFFGNIAGVTGFYPQEIKEKATSLQVHLINYRIFNNQVAFTSSTLEDGTLEVSYKDNMVGFEVTCFKYLHPEHIRYEYRLEPIINEWIRTPEGSNIIHFTNLNPGQYRFQVRAVENQYTSPVSEIRLGISPPWHQSQWMYAVYLISGMILVFLVTSYIMMQNRHKQEMEQKSRMEEINEARLQFFMNMSHEVRTPITLILNPLEKFLREPAQDPRLETYRLMYRNAQRILRLINQMMDIRKIDKGQMVLKFRETDLIGFIYDIIQTFGYQAEKRNMTVCFEHDMPQLKIWLDLENFDKVLMNLFSNAFKFTPDGGQIRVKAELMEDRQKVRIIVRDTGIGIEKSQIEKIFERFYQADNPLTRKNYGTGIGLHLSRALITLLHGTIEVQANEDGIGTSFIMTFPLGKVHLREEEIDTHFVPQDQLYAFAKDRKAEHELGDASEDTYKKPRSRTKYQLLIVDDDPEIRKYLRQELEPYYHVETCSDGAEAHKFILTRKPDLVLADIIMPHMDGITLCRKIKSNSNVHHIPIVLVSACSKEEDVLMGTQSGAEAYVVKPFIIKQLISTLQSIMENRERTRTFLAHPAAEGPEDNFEWLRSPDEQLLEKINKAIQERMADNNFRVETLAGIVGISRVHLHRKLKELTQLPASDYIRSVRLKRAAELISSRKMNVSEVAYATGFANLSHFSAAFKNYYGVSPRDYGNEQST